MLGYDIVGKDNDGSVIVRRSADIPLGAFARRAVLISRGSACSYSPKGDLPKAGLRGWLAFAEGSGSAFAACGASFYFPKGGCSRRRGDGSSWQGGSRRCCTIPFVARLAKTTGSEGCWVFILCEGRWVVAITLSPEELVRKGDGGWGGGKCKLLE